MAGVKENFVTDGILNDDGITYWVDQLTSYINQKKPTVIVGINDFWLIVKTLRVFQEKAWMYDELG